MYRFYVGNSVKNAVQITLEGKDGYGVEALQVVKQLEEALAPTEDFTRMKPGARKEDGSYELTFVAVPTRRISLAERIERICRRDLPQTGDQGYKLRDVHDGKVSMEDFIAQL